ATTEFSRRKPLDADVWAKFERGMSYCAGNFDDPASYKRLAACLEANEKRTGVPGNRIFYLATPPSVFATILGNLAASGLLKKGETRPWTRVVIEKPFGRDLASAQALNRTVHAACDERQVYRIDHYLGKETVQNIMALRFANSIFEPLLSRRHVDHVQITAAEEIGVEARGGYYEEAGVLRDMVQNHMMQLLTLTTMEAPVAFDADAVRDEKVKVLRAIRPITTDEVSRATVRGQYQETRIGNQVLPGYRSESGVSKTSNTPTFVALALHIDNWRWAGVPFYLRTGKRLARRLTEIAIQFESLPYALFDHQPGGDRPNVLVLRIQPDEGIAIRFAAKVPGEAMQLREVTFDFRYGAAFGEQAPEAYERLLLDCILGDATLFTREDEVEASWRLMDPILEAWRQHPRVSPYDCGSWGPPDSDELLARDRRVWRKPT
ncbi:MAG TPA: glucose-6-phosphate dehydrogenase, partial [Myxococcales bacterium]|nr:glucose-6-phosphate dehydrogenase [Myxococcales bacterium]